MISQYTCDLSFDVPACVCVMRHKECTHHTVLVVVAAGLCCCDTHAPLQFVAVVSVAVFVV
jgi:hypothetical protein